MKKIKFNTLCQHEGKKYLGFAEGYLIECAGREVGISKSSFGYWTATDLAAGLAFPVDEFFEKRKDLVDWLASKEDYFKKQFRKKKIKDRFAECARILNELKESVK